MSERLNTRGLAELLANKTGMDKKSAEEFIDALALYIAQGLERNKVVKIFGFGVFKILLVRERESIHIQTGERFVIPAHHKITFTPDKEFKEQINRPFALFEPIEATEFEEPETDSIETDDTYELPESFSPDENTSYEDEIAEQTVILDEPSEVIEQITFPDDALADNYFIESGYNIEDLINDESISNEEQFEPNEVTAEYEEQFEPQQLTVNDQFATFNADTPEYNADTPEYNTDTPEYNTDTPEYNADAPEYNADTLEYNADMPEYNAVMPEYNAVTQEHNVESDEDKYQFIPSGKKKKRIFIGFLITLIFISLFAGGAIGTYIFLQHNTDKTAKVNQPNDTYANVNDSQFSVSSDPAYDDDTSDNTETSLSNSQLMSNNETQIDDNNDEFIPTVTSSAAKPEENNGMNWQIPSPEKNRNEIKRADKPNPEIETKNRALVVNTRQTQSRNTETVANNRNSPPTQTAATATTPAKPIPASIRMPAGTGLMQLALEYYGNRIFWVYIYEANKSRISDFDNIPVGMELKLPDPKNYNIDPKNPSSVEKATQKHRELRPQ